jgi:hypothetical protein
MLYRFAIGTAAVSVLALTAGASAQRQTAQPRNHTAQKVTVETFVGWTVPAGQFNHLAKGGVGANIGLGYWLTDRIAVVANGGYGALNGERLASGRTSPDMQTWHYTGGLEGVVLRSPSRRWQMLADAGVGHTQFDSDPFTNPANAQVEFDHTYVTTRGGLRAQYAPSNRFRVSLGTAAHLSFAQNGHTNALRALDPTRVDPFDTIVTLPVRASVSVKL